MAAKITPIRTKGNLLFGQTIKQHRKQVHLTQPELANLISVNPNTIKNWERDLTKPDHELIPGLCDLLDIKLHELYQMDSSVDLSSLENRVIDNLRLLDAVDRKVIDKMISAMVDEKLLAQQAMMKESYSIFCVDPGASAAGVGLEVPEAPPTYTFLRKNDINANADAIVKVSGQSMEPVYHDGDMVYFRRCETALPGMDVIVDTDQGAVIKRIAMDGTLYSVNPAFPYPKGNDSNSYRIRGQVLGVVQSTDRVPAKDASLVEELFSDEIRDFKEEYNLSDWE